MATEIMFFFLLMEHRVLERWKEGLDSCIRDELVWVIGMVLPSTIDMPLLPV